MTEPQESLCIQMLQKIAKFESFIDAPTTMASINTKKQAAKAFLRNAPTRAMRREKHQIIEHHGKEPHHTQQHR